MLVCNETGLKLMVKAELLDELFKIGLAHYPKEFGGILIGYYSDGYKKCCIEATLLPHKFESKRFSFERSSEGFKNKLTQLYQSKSKLIYVGEWHTHPNGDTIPSGTDLKAMIEIVQNMNVNITNPILMLIGINSSMIKMSTYVLYNNKLLKYE